MSMQPWTSELALGTKDGDSWCQALCFLGVQILVVLACARSEMYPSSGDKEEKTNEQQQDSGITPAVKTSKNLKQGRKYFLSFGSPF